MTPRRTKNGDISIVFQSGRAKDLSAPPYKHKNEMLTVNGDALFCLPYRKYGAVLVCVIATESYGAPSVHQVGACRGGARIKRTRSAARVVKGHTLHITPITHPAGYVRVVDPGSLRLTPATQRATQSATTATAVESTPTQISCSSAIRM